MHREGGTSGLWTYEQLRDFFPFSHWTLILAFREMPLFSFGSPNMVHFPSECSGASMVILIYRFSSAVHHFVYSNQPTKKNKITNYPCFRYKICFFYYLQNAIEWKTNTTNKLLYHGHTLKLTNIYGISKTITQFANLNANLLSE